MARKRSGVHNPEPHRFRHRTTPPGTTTERGYGAQHVAERKRRLAIKHQLCCPYCKRACTTLADRDLHLPHRDDDRSLGYLPGLACGPCNLKAAARAGQRAQRKSKRADTALPRRY